MDINLWISIGLAIPLAIFANLLTPKAQNFVDKYVEKKNAEKLSKKLIENRIKASSLRKELDAIIALRSDSSALVSFYFKEIFRIASMTAAAIMFGGFTYIVDYSIDEKKPFDYTVVAVSQLIFFMLVFAIYLKGRGAYKVAYNIANYNKYCSSTSSLLQKLEPKVPDK